MPDHETLITFGARDSVLVARGEFWRLWTAGIVHIGLIHFVVNQLALRYLGNQLELALGSWRFFIVYQLSILAGNLLGGFWSLSVGAGASGGLFGLLGVGCWIENSMGYRFQGAYWKMVFINGVLGLVIPSLDHAAHIGGFLAGYGAACAFYLWSRNQFLLASLIFTVLGCSMFGLYDQGLRADRVYQRIQDQLSETDDVYRQYKHLTDIVRLFPEDAEKWFQRGVWFADRGYKRDAFRDFARVYQLGHADFLIKQVDVWRQSGELEKVEVVESVLKMLGTQKSY